MQLAITIDVDWANEKVLGNLFEKLDTYQFKATVFATHASEVLSGLDKSRYEIALHPNFNGLLNNQGKDFRQCFDEIHQIYPEAKGFRSHCLFQSSQVMYYAKEKGMIYDSNLFLPYASGLKPFYHKSLDILRFPYSWADDDWIDEKLGFEPAKLNLGNNELEILGFHPIHVFLNSDVNTMYQQAKPYLGDFQALEKMRNKTNPGIGTMFEKLLTHAAAEKIETVTLIEAAEKIYKSQAGR